MSPPVSFVTTSDGIRIAYCTHGDGPPLVFIRGWIGHLELHWSDPAFRSYFEALAGAYRVIRYDVRGNGLSQREVPSIDLEALLLDLEAVMDGLGLTDVTLYGATYGGPIAVVYAARHPKRVARLILDGTYARGGEISSLERQKAIIANIRAYPDFALQQQLSHFTHPEPEQALFRRMPASEFLSREVAIQLYSLSFKIDVSALLPEVSHPTLVLHRRGSHAIPFRLGRELASLLPDARLIPLEGTAHLSWEGDAAAALAAIGEFLGVELRLAPTAGAAIVQPPLTVLFTDMEGSTALTRRLGDVKAQELLRTHNTAVRQGLQAHAGREIKHTGDGIMASFTSPSRAIECAVSIQRAVAAYTEQHPEMPLQVRVGLNVGEPVAEEEDLFGTAVQLARRICDEAEGGQILVSDVVRQLVAGKGFQLAVRDEVVLKGFEDPVLLHEVRWRV